MLFYISVILAITGVWMIIRLYISSRRPLVDDAEIIDRAMEYFEIKGRVTPRKVPVGRIEYFYRSVKYNAEIILKSKKLKAGDRIRLSVKPDKPGEVEHYNPTPEFFVALSIFSLGMAGTFACLYWAGYL